MQQRTTLLAGGALMLIAVMFATMVTLVVLPGIQLLPFYRLEPENMLPAKETLLLMHDPSAKELERWKHVFPTLDDILSDRALDAVAIININHTVLSIGFMRRSGSEGGGGCDVGPYRIIRAEAFTCPSIQDLDQFLAPGPRLSADDGWKELGKLPKGSWSFVRREALPSAEDLAQIIMLPILLGNATHLLLFTDNEASVVRSWPASPLSARSEESVLFTPAENPEAVLALGNLDAVLRALDRGLEPEEHIIVEGLLLEKLEDLAGPQVSLRYALLPLLSENAQMHTARTASGTQAILLAGTAHSATDADARIPALHRSFALRHPDTELLEFAFDDGRFPFRTLRIAEDASKETAEQIRGWSVVISRDEADGAMLITAVNGRQSVVSNDTDLLRKFVMEQGTVLPLAQAKRPLVSRIVAGMLVPNRWLGNAPFWMPETGKSVISVEQNGERRTVRVRAMAH